MPSQMGRNGMMFHTLAIRSQKSEDFRKLPSGERQSHGDVPRSISSFGHWGQNIWNCGITNCNSY